MKMMMMMIATSGFLAALECIKLVFGRTPDLLAGLRGTLLLRGREGNGGERGRPLTQIPGFAPGIVNPGSCE